MTQERSNVIGLVAQQSHVELHFVIEIILGGRTVFAGDILLEVIVEFLVRIEFRALGRQVDQLDLIPVLGQAGLDGFAVVHAQVVDDVQDLALAPAVDSCTPYIEYPRRFRLIDTTADQLDRLFRISSWASGERVLASCFSMPSFHAIGERTIN